MKRPDRHPKLAEMRLVTLIATRTLSRPAGWRLAFCCLLGLVGLSPALPAAERVIRVGVETLAEPFTYADEQHRPAGFCVELMQAVARDQGLQVDLVLLEWPSLLEAFKTGRIDVICNAAETVERRSFMDFSSTTIAMDGGVFYREGAQPPRTLADLQGRRVALPPASRAYEYVKSHRLPVELVLVPSLQDCLDALHEGRADLVIATRLTTRYMLRRSGYANILAADLALPDFRYTMHFAVRKGDAALLAALNEGLVNVSRSGAYDTLHERWVGPLQPRPLRWQEVKKLALVATLVMALGLAGLLWQRRVLRFEQRQAEALRQSQERLQLVFESTQDGFWDYDVRTGQVVRSAHFAEMLGYRPEEIPATRDGFLALLHPEDRATHHHGLSQDWTGEEYFQQELRLRCRNGDWKWILNRGKIVARDPATGAPTRMAGTHTDITKRKQAEAEADRLQQKMLEAQKLESLGILAGGIAHDFNNLLTVIMGSTALIRMDPGLNPEHAQRLAKTLAAADRAALLCRQLLAYAGRGAYQSDRINLNRLIHDTTRLLGASLSQARIEYALDPDRPEVVGDPSQLGQVVMNLVLNAAESLGGAPGTVRIATHRLELGDAGLPDALPVGNLKPGPHVCLEITDTGMGMAPAVLARIFDPFFSTKFAGRGLGLAAVLGIVRTHQGGLTVTSAPEAGSTFRVYLPLAAPQEPPRETAPAAGEVSAAARGRVLLADDDEPVRELTSALLVKLGYAPVTARDGQEAVRLFSNQPDGFATVMLDITMPDLDGLAAMTQIRLLRPQVPVILFSGHSMQDTRRQVGQARNTEFLEKPFTIDRLRECLGRTTGVA